MKNRFLLFFLISVFALCSFAACATIGTPQGSTITIVNNTGYIIYYVYFSETTDNSWGSNRLRSDQIIRNGESATLQLPNPRVSQYDFMLVDSDGDQYIRMNENVRNRNRIEFVFRDIQYPSVTFVNNTGNRIDYVYIFTPDGNSFGDDFLRPDQVLRNGEYVYLRLPYFLGDVHIYNVMGISNNRNVYGLLDVNVRNNRRIELTRDNFVSTLDN